MFQSQGKDHEELIHRICSCSGDIFVTASAGTGKTHVLVSKYLHQLLQDNRTEGAHLIFGSAIEGILALTFTEKAAEEMKDRIQHELLNRNGGRGHSMISGLMRALPRAYISTIHGFCARLLREFPIQAGIDPSFGVLDEVEAGRLLFRSAWEVLNRSVREGDPHTLELIRVFGLQRGAPGRGLLGICLELYEKMRTAGIKRERLWDYLKKDPHQDSTNRFPETLEGLIRLIKGLSQPYPAAVRRFLQEAHPILDYLESIHEKGPTGSDIDMLLRLKDAAKGNWGKAAAGKQKKEITRYLDRLIEMVARLPEMIYAQGLTELIIRIEKGYREKKEARAMMDFHDLEEHCLELLEGSKEVCRRLQERFRLVMVDEFQDLNPLQKAIIDRIAMPGSGRLFVVGDRKQSIYLFRGADVSVFTETQNEVEKKKGSVFSLRWNRRSTSAIIEWSNLLFREVMKPARGPEDEHPWQVRFDEAVDEMAALRPSDHSQPVEIIHVDKGTSADEGRCLEAEAIACRILQMVEDGDDISIFERADGDDRGEGWLSRRPRFGDVAILLRAFTRVEIYTHALKRRGIPFFEVKGHGFYRSQETIDILNLLSWIDHGDDELALAGILRSPLVGLSDSSILALKKMYCRSDTHLGDWFDGSSKPIPREIEDAEEIERLRFAMSWLTEIRRMKDDLLVSELLEEILERTAYPSVLLSQFQGRQKLANMQKLVELARDQEAQGNTGLKGFVDLLREMVEEEARESEAAITEEGQDVVKIMTIHQSKGLEFPIVFVADLGRMERFRTQGAYFDKEVGFGIKPLNIQSGKRIHTESSRIIEDRLREKESEEQKRLFYVACTRARDHLVLSGGTDDAGPGSWKSWINDLLCTLREKPHRPPLRELMASRLITERRRDLSSIYDRYRERMRKGIPIETSDEAKRWASGLLQGMLGFGSRIEPEYWVSPTELNDLNLCARRSFIGQVLRARVPFRLHLHDPALNTSELFNSGSIEIDERLDSTPERIGAGVHRILEEIEFDRIPEAKELLHRLISKHLADVDSLHQKEVYDHLSRFLSTRFPVFVESREGALLREYPFALRLGGRDPSAVIHGVVDLAFRTKGRLWVIDYKYMEGGPEEADSFRIQLYCYAMAMRRLFGGDVQPALVFLKNREDHLVPLEPIGKEDRVERELIGLISRMRRMELGIFQDIKTNGAFISEKRQLRPFLEPIPADDRCLALNCPYRGPVCRSIKP